MQLIPIPGFDLYAVTESGDVYRIAYDDFGNRGKYALPHKLSPIIDRYGYPKVVLSKKNKPFYRTVHRLIALTLIPNPNGYSQVNHKNGIKTDNRVENLEWVSPKENVHHAHRNGLHNGCRTAVRLVKDSSEQYFNTIVEASDYLGHSRECFRRHLTTDSRHGRIDGWDFELIGGKERRKVILHEDPA